MAVKPPLFELNLADAKALYRRLNIAFSDLSDAYGFNQALQALRRGDLCQPNTAHYEVVARGLSLACCAAYARPFVSNKPGGDMPGEMTTRKLGKELLTGLGESWIALHNEVLRRRHEEYAHSDPEPLSQSITLVSHTVSETLCQPVADALTAKEVDQLFELITTMMQRVIGIQSHLRRWLIEQGVTEL